MSIVGIIAVALFSSISITGISLHKHCQRALIVPISFPDVIWTLTPTVTAALVNAVSALRIAEKPTLTHKTFSINNNAELHFYLLVL